MSQRRTLTVACRSGLGNRLKVLCSGLALAEATDRDFRMLWPTDRPSCGAGFSDLFDNVLPVHDMIAADLDRRLSSEDWWIDDGLFSDLPDPLSDHRVDLRYCHVDWLVGDHEGVRHREIRAAAEERLTDLRPNPAISTRIDATVEQIVRPAIGVHARRGDFLSSRYHVAGNLEAVIAQTREQLDRGARTVVLVTDDGAGPDLAGSRSEETGVRRAFRQAFGERVVETVPRSLDRTSRLAIEDAVVDLWVLRSTDVVIGTEGSSFSELGAAGRGVPLISTAGKAAAFRRVDRMIERTGFAPVVTSIGSAYFGRQVPLPVLTHRLMRPIRRFRRVRRREGGR